MALSYVDHPASGGTNYSVPFGYIAQNNVKVYVDDVLQVEGAGNDYTWFNATTIQFTAGSTPSIGQTIRIQRDTQNTSRLVDFQDAGNLTEFDLDLSANQNFYLAQESIDDFNDLSLKLTGVLTWDAQNHRIVNVADPVDAQDAVTLNYIDSTWTVYMDAQVVAAAASAAAALASETAAAASEAAAATSETNAAASEAQAAVEVTYAAEWANKAEDSLVSVAAGGDGVDDYSALHWANKAASWAASVNLPNVSGFSGYLLRVNGTETGYELFNLFGGFNTWSAQQTLQASGGSIWKSKSYDAGHDGAFQGFSTEGFDGVARGFVGSIPNSKTDSAVTMYTWDSSLGTPAWNRVFGASEDASALQLLAGNSITYNNNQLAMLNQSQTWSALQTFTNQIDISGTATQFRMYETDGAADENWKVQVSNGNFYINKMLDTGADKGGGYCFIMDSDALSNALLVKAHGIDTAGMLRVQGNVSPTSGEGLEFVYQSGIGYITGYDRSAGSYKNLIYRANTIHTFRNNAVDRFNIQDNSVQHNGATNSSIVMNAAVGQGAFYYMRENNVNKGLVYYSGSAHSMYIQKYADSSGSTVRNIIELGDTGTIYLRPAYDAGRNPFIINTGNANMGQYGSLYFGSVWDGATGSYYGLSHSAGGTSSNYMIMANSTATLISTASSTGTVYIRGGKNGTGTAILEVRTTDYRWNSEVQSNYAGRGTGAGTATRLPSGWSVSKVTTGQYRITHSLGTSAYTVVACANSTVGTTNATVANKGTTTFDIYTGGVDRPWEFIMRLD